MRRFSLLVAGLFLMAGCVQTIGDDIPEMEEPVQAVVPGEAIVLFSEGMMELIEPDLAAGSIATKSSELTEVQNILGVSSMKRVFPHAGRFEARTRAEGLHRWYRVSYDPSVPVTKAAEGLSALDGIEAVEPVRNIRNTAVFNDPKLAQQWHYYNDGSLDKSHAAGADVNVVPVWENYTTGNPDVIVAVVDGGIDTDHEDLAANYAGGFNFVRGTKKIVDHDHGTHVAGTVAAVNGNGTGVCGLAGGNAAQKQAGVRLLSCQIFEPDPDDPAKDLSADGADAIKWGADNGAVISQNSWGYVYETAEEQASAKIPSHLKAAIDYFIKYAGFDENGVQVGPMAGGVVIFAAGNDSREHDPIGKYDQVIAVGSIGPDFKRADYSNYGDWVDIAAPGGSVHYSMGQVLSTLPDNNYGYMQGTSMACPHVSGVAALVVSHFAGQGFTNATLRDKLLNGADASVISKNAKIGPLVDAFGAMTYGGKTAPEPVTSIEADVVSNNIHLTFKVSPDKDDRKAYGFALLASKDRELLSAPDMNALPSGVISTTLMTGDLKVGETISGVIGGLDFETDYHVAVAAFDYNRNWSALSPVISLTTDKNNPPVVTTAYQGDYKVKSHEILKVAYDISDPDGHNVTVVFDGGSDAASMQQNPDGTWQMTLTGNIADPGRYKAVITASDIYEASVAYEVDYEILENHAPVVIKDIEDRMFTMAGQKLTLDMNEYISDPDGEILRFDISISDNTVLHINPADNILHATTLGYGLTDVTIVASDSRGLSCTLVFKVLVKDPSDPLSLYPNPVTDYLTVSTMDAAETSVSILSSTGRTLYDATSEVSAFEPARIDMTSFAPGRYVVIVAFGGNEYKRTIVKL
ncbi:MAG: S8 family serine peptidase [Bacteroidales bacterium]|nr:S8 family serine peptidase [Bacteroidales bacterium]